MKKVVAGLTLMLLAACGRSENGNESLTEAGTSRNDASTVTESASAAPLQKEQALAVMEQRHNDFEKIGGAMKAISRELKGENADLSNVRSGAATLAQLAPQLPRWFPAGTGPDVGKTEARNEIWQETDDFAAKSRAFQEAAVAFNTAAQGTDLAAIRAAQANLGKSCKGCHDLYREEK